MKGVKELICYFLIHSPRLLNKTEIVKMLYLFEYYHVKTFGNQYTDIIFVRYNYGPYAAAIEEELDKLIDDDIIEREIIGYYDRTIYLHKITNISNLNKINISYEYLLDQDKALIADKVIDELSCKSYEEMIDHVYSTPPMVKILNKERKIGFQLIGEVLNMKESRPLKKFSREKIEEARKRLDKSSRGSDEEYYAHLLKINEELKILRGRANSCFLK